MLGSKQRKKDNNKKMVETLLYKGFNHFSKSENNHYEHIMDKHG